MKKQKKNVITGYTSEQKFEEKVAEKVAEKQIGNHEAPANHTTTDKDEDTRLAKMKSNEISKLTRPPNYYKAPTRPPPAKTGKQNKKTKTKKNTKK